MALPISRTGHRLPEMRLDSKKAFKRTHFERERHEMQPKVMDLHDISSIFGYFWLSRSFQKPSASSVTAGAAATVACFGHPL